MAIDRKVRVGVIGAGGIANGVHLPSLTEIEDCEVVALCDLRYEKAVKTAERFGIKKTYWDMYEMLKSEELDCVYILVEPDRLFRAASDCMNAGLPVMMEKPAGTSAHQANALARIARERGVTCAVAMNRRHIPVVQEVKRMMAALGSPITALARVAFAGIPLDPTLPRGACRPVTEEELAILRAAATNPPT